MDNRKLKLEATLYSTDDPNHTSVVEYPDDGCNEPATNLQHTCNAPATPLQRTCNDPATPSQRPCNGAAPAQQTRNATLTNIYQKLIVTDKAAVVVAENQPICDILTQRNFISDHTPYSNIEHLPVNAPDDLVAALEAKGHTISQSKLTRLILCLRITRRFRRSTVVLINAAWIIVLFIVIYLTQIKPTLDTTTPTASAVQSLPSSLNDDAATHAATLDAAIAEWESAGGQKIYPGGRACLLAASVGMTKQQILELIKNNVK